jgi:PPM family protein phosphatase
MDTERFLVKSDGRVTVTFGSRSSVGLVRTENQDSCGIFLEEEDRPGDAKGILCVVADGMGGHEGGKEASSLVIDVLQQAFLASPAANQPLSLLKDAFYTANAAVFERAHRDPRLSGMGTTCTALVLHQNSVYVAHIGDSRAYLVRRKKVVRLTEDHSRVGELLRHRLISEEAARVHPDRSLLLRALGIAPVAEVQFLESPLQPGVTWYVLCSDGLSGLVEDSEIQHVALSYHPQEACDLLTERANARGGHDNATVIIVRVSLRECFLTSWLRPLWPR